VKARETDRERGKEGVQKKKQHTKDNWPVAGEGGRERDTP